MDLFESDSIPSCSGIDLTRMSLYNQLKSNQIQEKAKEEGTVPNFDLDDHDLLDRVEQARVELDILKSKTMSLEELNTIFKTASEHMSDFSNAHHRVKNSIVNQVGSVHTFSEDLSFILNGKLPFGYDGNLKDCLRQLKTKIDNSSNDFDSSESDIIKLSSTMEFIFFQMNTIYSELLKKIEKYEEVMQKLSAPTKKETFTLDTALSSD